MNTAIQFSSLTDLPELLVTYFFSNQLVAFVNGLLVNYEIDSEKRDEIIRLQGDIIFRTLPIEDLPGAIETRLGINEPDKIHSIAQDIYNEFCGPIRWYFPNLAERLAKTGYVLNASDLFPQLQPKTSLAEAVSTIMGKVGDLPRTIKERVQKIVESVLKEQQLDSELLQKQLLRPVTEGGIGIGEKNARVVVIELEDYLALYSFSDVPDKHEITVAKKPLPPTLDPTTLAQDVLEPYEAEELAQATAAANEVSTSVLSTNQQSLVDAVLAAESLHDRSENIQKQWRIIVEARIGGARDAAKTRSMLESPEAAGGLGLTAAEATRLADLLEQTASGFEKRREEFSVIEKIASMKQQAEGIMAGPEAADRGNQKQLNDRFVSMFGKGAVEEMRRETHREIESPEKAHPGEEARSHVAPINLTPTLPQKVQPPPASIVPMVPPPPSAPPQPQQEPKYLPKVPDKLRMLIDAEKPIFPLKPSVAPLKKSADIRPGMKLVGPVDELRTMSMVDFRRLSPDVSVRIQKIRSRIEVIAEDGPHEKIRAIQAFEQSDPVRLYRELLKRSLIDQRGVEELSADFKTQGKEYLDAAEIAALRQFLTQIRYSSL